MPDVYQKLANHLDRLPGGFPATESGIEIKILKKLFTEEQALIASALNLRPETAEAISERVDIQTGDIKSKLDEMAGKGLIFRSYKTRPLYMAAQFVIGIWEYHVNDLDAELIQYFNAYVPYLTKQWTSHKTNQLRVIPISQSLDPDLKIMPYEAAEKIIGEQSKIVVAPCICRKEHDMVGKGCSNPIEVCLIFGAAAFYYEKNGLGRSIEQDEALNVLAQGIEAGLVLQPGNSKKTNNICMCCGCCCQVLKNLNALPNPSNHVHSSYYALVDKERCVGCAACEERCHMSAITLDGDDLAVIHLDRCIGCGVCVPACETEAISLAKKPAAQQWDPPETVSKTYLNIALERGVI